MEVIFIPAVGSERELARAAFLSSVPDHSPEAHAIFLKSLEVTREIAIPRGSHLIPPSESEALSGVDLKDRKIRKGSLSHIVDWLHQWGALASEEARRIVIEVEGRGHRAVVVADHERELGVIEIVN